MNLFLIVNIRVIPNSKKVSIERIGTNSLKVKVKSKAMEGAANAELVDLLSEKLGVSVALVRGRKSREKVLQLNCTEDELAQSLK